MLQLNLGGSPKERTKDGVTFEPENPGEGKERHRQVVGRSSFCTPGPSASVKSQSHAHMPGQRFRAHNGSGNAVSLEVGRTSDGTSDGILAKKKKVWRSPGRICLGHGSKDPILTLAAYGEWPGGESL